MKNTQVDTYKERIEPKFHELRLLEIIEKKFSPEFNGRVLDIGCASGAFLKLLSEKYFSANLCGFDFSNEMVSLAKERLGDILNVDVVYANALTFEPESKFDLIVASGILGVFEDIEVPLDRWLSWLCPGGTMFLFGCFNKMDIDTIVRFRNNYKGSDWEGGLTSYSLESVKRYLDSKGLKFEIEKFNLPISLPRQEDPIRSFTVDTVDGERLILNGANILTDFYYVIISK